MSAIKFEDFNFEIIDIDLPGRPYMLIGKNTLSFSKVVAERMNYPAQILAYFDHSTQTFAIKGCKVGAHSSIRFSKSKTEQKGRISLNSSAISGLIKINMKEQWKENGRYEIEGIYISENNSMIFNLNDAKELGKFKGGRATK